MESKEVAQKMMDVATSISQKAINLSENQLRNEILMALIGIYEQGFKDSEAMLKKAIDNIVINKGNN